MFPLSLALHLFPPLSFCPEFSGPGPEAREGAHGVKRTIDAVRANAEGYKGGPMYARSTYVTISGMYHPRGPAAGHVIPATRRSL